LGAKHFHIGKFTIALAPLAAIYETRLEIFQLIWAGVSSHHHWERGQLLNQHFQPLEDTGLAKESRNYVQSHQRAVGGPMPKNQNVTISTVLLPETMTF